MKHRCPACKLSHDCAGQMWRNLCKLRCPKYDTSKPMDVYIRTHHMLGKSDTTKHDEGSVDYYLAVRPIFEEAYDAAHLGWEVAIHADHTLYRLVLKYGPTQEAIEHVLTRWTSRNTPLGRAVMSLEALLDLVNERGEQGDDEEGFNLPELDIGTPVGAYDEAAVLMAAIEHFGLNMLPSELRELMKPPALTVQQGPKPSSHMQVSSLLPLQCDLCLKDTGAPLYRITRDGLEACYQCLMHPVIRKNYSTQPYNEAWLRERMRRY